MVQSTVQIKKLRITKAADHIKPGSAPHEDSSKTAVRGSSPPQHPDAKTSRGGGPHLKKKMKKSGSIRRSTFDSLRSFPFEADVSQTGRRSCRSLPNYMKPTTSSDARKDQSLVASPPGTRKVSNYTRTRRMSPNTTDPPGPGNDNFITPVKNPKRPSSLGLMRTFIKTLSFKPARSTPMKRCTEAVLSANMKNPQRATCSSTLKDSKFPKYLALSPGATEAEGTSAMKVCPYTYCSLNGHRHAPLPPLKCFISSRRSAIKTQRSLKVGATETEAEALTLVNGPTKMEDDDGRDFIIHIYAEADHKDVCHQESSLRGEKESAVQEEADLPISVPEEASSIKSSQGKYGSELEYHETREEAGSESLDMEWDGDRYSTVELDEAADHSTGDETALNTEEPEVCSGLLLIGWKNMLDGKLQGEQDEACPEAQQAVDQVYEMSEPIQVLDHFSYDQYASSDEEELEEVEEEMNAEDVEEIIGSDPILHQPHENQDPALASFSSEHESGLSTTKPQCSCREEEDTAGDEVNAGTLDERSQGETQDVLPDEQLSQINNASKSQNLEMSDVVDDENMKMVTASEDSVVEVDHRELEIDSESSIAEEPLLQSHKETTEKSKNKYTRAVRNSDQDLKPYQNRIGKNKCAKLREEEEDPRRFNPRDPNYLPVVPDPEAEKVDLRHQMVDERRNSDEWMIDYALRQAVTRLAPARKRKVALLVEAFEKVLPTPNVTSISKWETHLTSPRPIQACS